MHAQQIYELTFNFSRGKHVLNNDNAQAAWLIDFTFIPGQSLEKIDTATPCVNKTEAFRKSQYLLT